MLKFTVVVDRDEYPVATETLEVAAKTYADGIKLLLAKLRSRPGYLGEMWQSATVEEVESIIEEWEILPTP